MTYIIEFNKLSSETNTNNFLNVYKYFIKNVPINYKQNSNKISKKCKKIFQKNVVEDFT